MKKHFLALLVLVLAGAGCFSSANTVRVSDLTFTLPPEWTVVSQEGSRALIKVPDPRYDVVLPLVVTKYEPAQVKTSMISPETFIATTSSGASLYSEVCAPTMGCEYVQYKGATYLVTFEVPQSNEVAPEDLDGPWFPSTTVTREEIVQVFSSVK